MNAVNHGPGPRHVFGPVPSRHLGRSLGVDPIPPKTCTYNCAYCQLGPTADRTCERRARAAARIIDDLGRALRLGAAPDWVTLSGSDEPTPDEAIPEVIADYGPCPASPGGGDDVAVSVCELLRGRPCTVPDFGRGLGLHLNEVADNPSARPKHGGVWSQEREGRTLYGASRQLAVCGHQGDVISRCTKCLV